MTANRPRPSCRELFDDAAPALRRRQPVELARVDEHVVLRVGDVRQLRLPLRRPDHLAHGQVERLREVVVALVVGGHGHDRAGAIVGEDVVGDVHRDPLAVDRVDRVQTREDAGLLDRRGALLGLLRRGVAHVAACTSSDVDPRHQLVLGREHEERRPKSVSGRVVKTVTSSPHSSIRKSISAPSERPIQFRWRALIESGQSTVVEVVEQRVGVVGDPEEPLLHHARLDQRAAALTGAVAEHLLVGEHGLVVRAPLHRRALAVREPLLEEAEELPLLPAVVARIVGRDLAVPVHPPPHPAHRPADVDDVALGGLARVLAFLDRAVLGRQPEGVPAHRVEHAQAVAAPEAHDDVADRVDEQVAEVQRAGRVRQHLEHVALGAVGCGRVGRVVDVPRSRLVPDALPLLLDRLRVVRLAHRCLRVQKSLSQERPGGSSRGSSPRWPPALGKKLLHCAHASTVPRRNQGRGGRARELDGMPVTELAAAVRDAARRLRRGRAARARADVPAGRSGRARRLRDEGVSERRADAPARRGGARRGRVHAG